MNNQMMPLATNAEEIQGERLEAAQMAATCDDVEECNDFSYDGFQVVRREFLLIFLNHLSLLIIARLVLIQPALINCQMSSMFNFLSIPKSNC